jgi:hypothetical protein
MSATTTLWRFIIHSLGSGYRCNGEKPGFAEPTRRTTETSNLPACSGTQNG